MPVFQYQALDKSSRGVSGAIEAESAREARRLLRDQGVFVTAIQEAGRASVALSPLGWLRTQRGRREVGSFTRQLAALLAAGMRVADALRALIDQTNNAAFEAVLRDVHQRITRGASLADALAAHPAYFGALYTNMVRVAEGSGKLDEVLGRISEYLRSREQLSNKITTAMTYPIVMVIVGIAVVGFLLTFAIPKITSVLLSAGKTLPLPTVILVQTSGVVAAWWPVLLAAVIGAYILLRLFFRTERGRLWRDGLLLRLPVIGPLCQKLAMARFTMAFSVLLKSGVKALDALKIVEDVPNNAVISRTIRAAREGILAGSDIAETLGGGVGFPPLLIQMIAVGEQSGSLENSLDHIARTYEEEAEITVQRLTALFEPAIIVALAAVVAFIVLAILLPILEISNVTF
ncbi:MAG: type II secretion system F family protein [Planctomycetota bacterium]